MRFMSPLLAVKNMEKSKQFYTEVLGQKISMDVGANVTFRGNFALQQGFAELVGLDPASVKEKSHNAELYFDEDDIEAFDKRLREYKEVSLVHGIKQYPWGQRVIRLYDPDGHIIEVGENMKVVVKRFLIEGMGLEEVGERTMYPLAFIKRCKRELEES